MNITIRTIPHKSQPYSDVGDWFVNEEGLQIRVSDLSAPDYEFLIGVHELIESWLCLRRKLTDETVTMYDVNFIRQHGNGEVPGEDPQCPYRDEHRIALSIEKTLCHYMGLSWTDYERHWTKFFT